MTANRHITGIRPENIYIVREPGSAKRMVRESDIDFLRRSGAPDELIRSTEQMVTDRRLAQERPATRRTTP
jgi:hypothetical protein